MPELREASTFRIAFTALRTRLSRRFLEYRFESSALLADTGALIGYRTKGWREFALACVAFLLLGVWPFLALVIGAGDLGNKYWFGIGFVFYPMLIETLGIDLRHKVAAGEAAEAKFARAYAFSSVIGVCVLGASLAVLRAVRPEQHIRGVLWGIALAVSISVARDLVAWMLVITGGRPLYARTVPLNDLLDEEILPEP